jgi:HAD superfamily hydrolase (TIGR01509 family)
MDYAAEQAPDMPSLQALIFDVDGTLAETEELHRAAFNQTFPAFPETADWHWSHDLYAALLATTGGKERIAAYWRRQRPEPPDIPLIASIHATKTRAYEALVHKGALTLRPGIDALIAEARRQGCRLAIASTTSFANIEALCQACFRSPATEIFPIIAAGDEVVAKKPAPDIYRLALTRLGLEPHQCLAIEDSSNGLRAAHAAGLRCVVTPSLYSANEDFTAAELVLEDLSAGAGLNQILSKLDDRAGFEMKR